MGILIKNQIRLCRVPLFWFLSLNVKREKNATKHKNLIYMKMIKAHNKDAYWSSNLTYLYFVVLFGYFFIKILSGIFHIVSEVFSEHPILLTFFWHHHAFKHRIDLFLLLPGCSHLYRLTNKQVSCGLFCQNTIEQVSDNIQRINRINVSLFIERP